MSQNLIEMAEAGFIYSGYADSTICYSCGNGLRGWLKNEDPYEEHAWHYPQCKHLEQRKGKEFIERVQRQKKACPIRVPKCIRAPEEARLTVLEDGPAPVKECLICTTEERAILFEPCLHFCTCLNCSTQITQCCVCRKTITKKVKIFSP